MTIDGQSFALGLIIGLYVIVSTMVVMYLMLGGRKSEAKGPFSDVKVEITRDGVTMTPMVDSGTPWGRAVKEARHSRELTEQTTEPGPEAPTTRPELRPEPAPGKPPMAKATKAKKVYGPPKKMSSWMVLGVIILSLILAGVGGLGVYIYTYLNHVELTGTIILAGAVAGISAVPGLVLFVVRERSRPVIGETSGGESQKSPGEGAEGLSF